MTTHHAPSPATMPPRRTFTPALAADAPRPAYIPSDEALAYTRPPLAQVLIDLANTARAA